MNKFLLSTMFATISIIGMAQIPTNGLVSYYSFNDGTADDNFGPNNGTNYSAIQTTDQFTNDSSAFDFNGSSSYIDLGTDPSIKPTNATISLWAKLDAISNSGSGATWNPMIIAKNNNIGSYFEGYSIMLRQSDRKITTVCTNDVNNSAKVIYGSTMPINEWTHIVLSFDDDSMSLFVNGILENTIYKGYTSTFSATEQVKVGRMLGGSNNRYFNGKIDEVRIYNRVLSNNEITELHSITDQKFDIKDVSTSSNSPVCINESTTVSVDNSENGINYYLTNNNIIIDGPVAGSGNSIDLNTNSLSSTTDFTIHASHNNDNIDFDNTAITFDGIDDEISFAVDNTFRYDTSYTIEGWVKVASPNNTNRYPAIFSIYTANETDIEIYVQNTTNDIVVAHNRGKVSGFNAKGFSDPFDNEWFHLAVSYDGTNIKAYYNGVLQSIVQNLNTPTSPTRSNNTTMSFGSITSTPWNSYNSNFNGELDNIRIWSTARTQIQIEDEMNNCLSGDEQGLVGLYKFDESNGTATVNDYSITGTDGTLNNFNLNNERIASPFYCGIDLSTTQNITVDNCTGIEEFNKSTLSLYPNPSSGLITINSEEKINTIKVIDFSGRVLFSNNSTSTIDLSSFENGIYFIEINTNNGSTIKKIVMQN